jgi:NADH-quinone oxidoreductase E subunit
MSFVTAADKGEILEIAGRYPFKRAALIPALHLVQRRHGWIPPEAMAELAGILEIRPVEVMEVVSFYTMLNPAPVGRYHIQVCRNLSCALRGARRIARHLSSRLGIEVGGTTADGRFTLSEVECMGSCGTAPMLQLNDDYYEDLTEARVDEILASLMEAG